MNSRIAEDESFRRQFVETSVFREVRSAVAEGVTPILLLGLPGSGKSSLLQALSYDWGDTGKPVVYIRLYSIGEIDDLVDALRTALGHELPRPVQPAVVGSSRHSYEGIRGLGSLGERGLLILLDGLDESRNPSAIVEAARLLSRENGALVVVASREGAVAGGEVQDFHQLHIRRWTIEEFQQLLVRVTVDAAESLPADELQRRSAGNPLFAQVLLNTLARGEYDPLAGIDEAPRLAFYQFVESVWQREAHSGKRDFESMRIAFARLALYGDGGLQLQSLSSEEAGVLEYSPLVSREGSTVRIIHASIAEAIIRLSGLLPPEGTRLRDLSFGAEEAERDTLLNASYEEIPGAEDLRSGQKNIVIGDRGAGKSALFKAVTEPAGSYPQSGIGFISLDDPVETVLRLESNGEKLASAEQFRAAWLLSLAGSLATQLRLKSLSQQRSAARLRAALPGVVADKGFASRVFSLWSRIKHTSIKFRLGTVVLEPPQTTDKAAHGGRPIDIAEFLAETGNALRAEGMRVVVAVDRIDEVHKYRRELQELLVQGLFLAEASLSRTPEISLLVFIRTDLIESYDIQEKNKLVSRTLRLRWSRSSLMRLLIRRICLNSQLDGITRLMSIASETSFQDVQVALFPRMIEEMPFEEWLWNGLQNGNGQVSPRQFILLLTLLRETPGANDYVLDALPIFKEDVLRRAMTRLSELSFGEVIDDFRVGRTFLRSCRAAKLEVFSMREVEGLFDEGEGAVALQLDLLERLGVLERLVLLDGGDRFSKFRIPALYTRCWGTEVG